MRVFFNNFVSRHFPFPGTLYPNGNKAVDIVTNNGTIRKMIQSFKHKGLAELFEQGRSRRVRQDLQSRCLRRLDALDQAKILTDFTCPGSIFTAFRECLSVIVYTLMVRGVSPLSGKKVRYCGSILNNIIEVKP